MTFDSSTLCNLLDLTPRRVQQLTAQGVLCKVSRGRYDLLKSVRGYVAYLRDRADRVAGAEDPALDRKRLADAKLAELKLEVRRSERLPAVEVRQMMQRAASAVRSRFQPVPRAVASRIKPGFTAGRIERIARMEIDAALGELSNSEPQPIPAKVAGDNPN